MNEPMESREQQIEKNMDEAASVRYLTPDDFTLFRTEAGALRMTLHNERSILRVMARRAFPFAAPERFISLRDGKGEEIGILPDLRQMPPQYRQWIIDDLELRYYTPRLRTISSIKRRWGGVDWNVDTTMGPRRFITRGIHDTMAEVEQGRFIVTDVEGNRYEILVNELDDASKALLDRTV